MFFPVMGARKVDESFVPVRVAAPSMAPDLLVFPHILRSANTVFHPCEDSWRAFGLLTSQSYVLGSADIRDDQLTSLRKLSRLTAFELGFGADVRWRPEKVVELIREGVGR